MDPETNSVMVTWTAPSAGNYSMSGFFSGIDTSEGSHPVEVVLDSSTVLFSTTINTFGQDYTFSSPTPLALNADDTITFEVETGNGGYDLGTGFDATISNISSTPEPSSFLLLGTGILGVAFLIRKKLAH